MFPAPNPTRSRTVRPHTAGTVLEGQRGGGVERDDNGLPILRPIDEGLQILAHASDAACRVLWGRPYVECPPALAELTMVAVQAATRAVAQWQSPNAN